MLEAYSPEGQFYRQQNLGPLGKLQALGSRRRCKASDWKVYGHFVNNAFIAKSRASLPSLAHADKRIG